MPQKGFAVVDFETTGFSPQHHHRVIEVGIVHVSPDGTIEREFETVVNPGRDLGPTHIHRLRGANLKDAPTFDEIADQLIEHLRGRVLVAHNARFETSFLRAEFARLGITSPVEDADAICTMKLAKTHLPGVSSKLTACCAALDIPLTDAHEALADARATAQLLGEYRRMGRQDAAWWRHYETRAGAATWPARGLGNSAAWVARGRQFKTTQASYSKTQTDTTHGSGGADRPLLEQALDWLLPVARQRFGTRPVAVAERVARNVIAARTNDKLNYVGSGTVPRDRRGTTASHVPGEPAPMRRPPIPRLSRGDVIVLTGVMAEPRDRIEERLVAAGFVVEPGVTKRTTLLVAADLDSLSGKAQKARRFEVPIVGEDAIRALIRRR